MRMKDIDDKYRIIVYDFLTKKCWEKVEECGWLKEAFDQYEYDAHIEELYDYLEQGYVQIGCVECDDCVRCGEDGDQIEKHRDCVCFYPKGTFDEIYDDDNERLLRFLEG